MKSITIVGCGVMGSRLTEAMMNVGVNPVIVVRHADAIKHFINRGAKYSPTLRDAEETDCILLNLPHHGIASEVLKACPKERLAGKMLIDTTTSTINEVKDMAAIAKDYGMDYLDAKIMCYPGDIATETGGLVYAGSKSVYDTMVDPVFTAFGRHNYLGEDITLASVTDTGVCNVHFGAIGSLLEAAAFCVKNGCDLDTFIDQIRTFLPLMFEGNLRAFTKELKDYDGKFADATECSLEIETQAVDTLRHAINDSGVLTPVGDTLYKLFSSGIEAGDGKKNVVSVINRVMK